MLPDSSPLKTCSERLQRGLHILLTIFPLGDFPFSYKISPPESGKIFLRRSSARAGRGLSYFSRRGCIQPLPTPRKLSNTQSELKVLLLRAQLTSQHSMQYNSRMIFRAVWRKSALDLPGEPEIKNPMNSSSVKAITSISRIFCFLSPRLSVPPRSCANHFSPRISVLN